jgi:hypothetical protein
MVQRSLVLWAVHDMLYKYPIGISTGNTDDLSLQVIITDVWVPSAQAEQSKIKKKPQISTNMMLQYIVRIYMPWKCTQTQCGSVPNPKGFIGAI